MNQIILFFITNNWSYTTLGLGQCFAAFTLTVECSIRPQMRKEYELEFKMISNNILNTEIWLKCLWLVYMSFHEIYSSCYSSHCLVSNIEDMLTLPFRVLISVPLKHALKGIIKITVSAL